MMTQAGSTFTAGPASVYDSNNTLAVCIGEVPTGKRPCIVDWPGFDSCDLPFDEQRANATFIAEAFTVAHETGLMPRQLVEQRDELLAVLRRAEQTTQELCHGQHPDNECWNVLRAIRAAIAKATDGGA